MNDNAYAITVRGRFLVELIVLANVANVARDHYWELGPGKLDQDTIEAVKQLQEMIAMLAGTLDEIQEADR